MPMPASTRLVEDSNLKYLLSLTANGLPLPLLEYLCHGESVSFGLI
jgi:hypothetical protein